jgi:hypothetical protein
MALFLLQILLGATTAHYQVEREFYGADLSQWLPYSVTRSWHTQLAVLWIATAWLATGLYIAPAISGHEPRFQRLGVNVLFTCLLVIVGRIRRQWLVVAAPGPGHLVWPPGWNTPTSVDSAERFLLSTDHLAGVRGPGVAAALRRKDDMASIVTLMFLSTSPSASGAPASAKTTIAVSSTGAGGGSSVVGVLRGVRRAVIASCSQAGLVRAHRHRAVRHGGVRSAVCRHVPHLYWSGTAVLEGASRTERCAPRGPSGARNLEAGTAAGCSVYRWPIMFFPVSF